MIGAKRMFHQILLERRCSRATDQRGVLGSDRVPGFPRTVEDALFAFNAPIAVLPVVRDDQQWLGAATGLSVDRTPRRDGFCSVVLDQPDVLQCRDPLSDPRFRCLPVVTGGPMARSCMGAPMRRPCGMTVGVLRVIDMVRRPAAPADQKACLAGLAHRTAVRPEARAQGRTGRTAA